MAFKLDAMRSSHPIHVPVRDALDVNQIFDHISYLKGCSTLRMLVNHLGERIFLQGVSIYLKKHAYGNAKTEALWQGLAEASGVDVDALMGNWIKKIGFPMLTVAEEPGQITVKQCRFLSTGDVKPEEDETTWWLPLGFQGKTGIQEAQSIALTTKEDTIRDVDDDFYKLNHNGTGFYRTNYPPARLAKLGSQLNKLSTEDKVSIIGSAADLATSGYGSTPALLSFLEGFSAETNQIVWSQALDALGSVKAIFGDDEETKTGLENFTLTLINGALEKIGWEYSEGEGFLKGILRKRLLLSAVANGHQKSLEKAVRIFEAWSKDGAAFNPNLRTVVYRAAIKLDEAKAWGPIKKEWESGASIDGKDFCISALGHIRDADLISQKLLPFLFDISSESVASADMHTLASAMAANSVARPMLWQYLQANWQQATTKMANPVVLDRFIRVTLQKFTDAKYIGEMDNFFKEKDTSAFDRTLEQVKDAVRGRAAYRERDAAVLKEWLGVNGYTSK